MILAAADKTFGLKNKNKSTKVKSFVNQVHAGANATTKKKGEAHVKQLTLAEKRKLKKEQEKAQHEMSLLFQEVPKSKGGPVKEEAEEEEDLSHLSLEEWMDHKRAGLGLAVGERALLTDESFREWRDGVNAARKAAEDAEMTKRYKGGRLTGREFFAQASESDVRAGGAEEGGVDFSQYGKASSDVEDSDDEDVAAGLTAEDEAALAALGDEDLAALEDVDALADDLGKTEIEAA